MGGALSCTIFAPKMYESIHEHGGGEVQCTGKYSRPWQIMLEHNSKAEASEHMLS